MIGEGPPEVQLFLLQPFQCRFQCGFLLPASAGVASHVRQVRLANLRQRLWCHLDVAQKLRNLLIHQGAGEIEMAAGDAVVGHPVGGATAVGGRAGELDQPAIRLFEIDQALQQIEVLLLWGGLVVAFRQDRQPQLKFLGRYHRLPAAANGLRRDIGPVIVHHHPPGIKPVVKRLGQRGLPGSGFATRIQMHKRHAASQPVTASSQRLADVFQRGRILQQQVPGITPDFCLLRVDFDPALVTGMVVLFFWTEFGEPNLFVEIPIRCPPRPFPLEQFGQHPADGALAGDGRLAFCHAKQDVEIQPVIGVSRIEIGVRGETYLDAKPGHLVNRAQRLNIVSSEAVRRAGEHVGESALTRISQHLLVVLTISGCPGVVVDVFAQISECMTAHQPLVYIPALGRLRPFR